MGAQDVLDRFQIQLSGLDVRAVDCGRVQGKFLA
jgi:hypothetical protein